jgi:hypothetical protein
MTLTPRMPMVLAAFLLVALAVPASAADNVTYSEHVAPILQANCVSCHMPAGKNIGSLVAPMSLMTYEEVRPWARAISRKVKAREMPPWFADGPKGVFTNERGLTEKEIDTLMKWAAAGAPAGDPAKLPKPVEFAEAKSGGYSLGPPDLIVKMPEPYFVNDDAEDVQGIFLTKLTEEMLPRDVTVRAWEFRAGTYKAGQDTVHHMCGGVREPGAAPIDTPAAAGGKDAQGLELGCIAGGAEAHQLPEGYGRELKAGSTIVFNMHYYKRSGPGTGYMNQAEVGFYFAKGPVKHKVKTKAIGNLAFEIPPYKTNHRIGAAETLAKDTLILAYWPHAHLRATAARYMATYPDGRRELLLDVPRYDQSWQVTYKLREPKMLPKGTRLDVEMLYDNSADRGAKRTFNPNLAVHFGARTQDEMMLGFLSYAELEPGESVATQQQD